VLGRGNFVGGVCEAEALRPDDLLIFNHGGRERGDSQLLPHPVDQPFEFREPRGVVAGGRPRPGALLRRAALRDEAAAEQ
jgi:hypothetical protein